MSHARSRSTIYTDRMTDRTPDHHTDTTELDAWLDAINALAPGSRNARTFPPEHSLVHMTAPSGDVVLRQWPPEMTAERLGFLADVLDAAHAAVGGQIPTIEPLAATPDERSVLIRGHRYSRSPYLPGRPLGRYGGFRTPDGQSIDVPLHESAGAHDLVAEASRILARVHDATGEIAARKDAPVTTLSSMLQSVRDVWFEQRRILGDKAAGQRDIRRWLRCGNRIIPASSDLLRNEEALMVERSVVIHGDLWPVNVLIEGRESERRITGIVGWSGAAAGSPVLDLAALAVHMQGWSAAMTEAIVESYSDIRPLLPEQRRLVPVVASLDLVARVAGLLRLAYLDDRMIGHPAMPVLRSGMKTLLNSLETLTSILVPDVDTTRRWQYGPRDPDRPARRPAPRTRPGDAARTRPGRSKERRRDQ